MKMAKMTIIVDGNKYVGKPRQIPDGTSVESVADKFRTDFSNSVNFGLELENGTHIVLFREAISRAVFLIG